MIKVNNKQFTIDTSNTTYAMYVNKAGYLAHLYYGQRIENLDFESLIEPSTFAIGNGIVDVKDKTFTPENACLEMSTIGKGDIREHSVEVLSDVYVSKFLYKNYEILSEYSHPDLPYAKANDKPTEILKITLFDNYSKCELYLYYQVFQDSDVLVKWSEIKPLETSVVLKRLMSSQLDLDENGFTVHSLAGRWVNEANLISQKAQNKITIESRCGVSSSRHNPFFFLERGEECIAFNLIYSGNHLNIIEQNSFDKLRVVQGINDFNFEYTLSKGESFVSAQAVCTYTNKGRQQMQKQMHDFIHSHIIPKAFKDNMRPVLINSWEANYFNINESKLLKLARAAKKVGIELLVMDDGWFSKRNNDKSSLGDWQVNKKKLPNGVSGLAQKINDIGLDFGIWIEPEMINVDSDLYRTHPEYAVKIDDDFGEGRNQLILDLSNIAVVEYLKQTFSDLLSSANIAYVKWDMNRIFSDMFGSTLSHQGQFFHEYQKGLTALYSYLTEQFPEILFENCSSGGNRFDLGMLCFSPQIWTSDNTDAIERTKIVKNMLLGYPQSTMGAHVSDYVNHQTLRKTPLSTRFNVNCFGVLGYELDLSTLSKQELLEIAEQVAFYKKHRKMFQFGTIEVSQNGNITQFSIKGQQDDCGALMVVQSLVEPHSPSHKVKYPFLLEANRLKIEMLPSNVTLKEFGSLINYFSPITIKQNGVLHNVADKVYKMNTETHSFEISPNQLHYAGFYLKQAFCTIGYNKDVRMFKDFDSKLYTIEKID